MEISNRSYALFRLILVLILVFIFLKWIPESLVIHIVPDLVSFFEGSTEYVEGSVLIIAYSIISVLTLCIAFFYFVIFSKWDILYAPRITTMLIRCVLSLTLIMMLGSVVGLLIFQYFEIDISMNPSFTRSYELPYFVFIYSAYQILLVAPSEEIVYRGIVHGELREYFSLPATVILSSIIFGVAHIRTGGGLIYVFSTMIGGLILGYSYERTKNILVPILIHGLFNVSAIVMMQVLQIS